jgi:hyaluronan synthase
MNEILDKAHPARHAETSRSGLLAPLFLALLAGQGLVFWRSFERISAFGSGGEAGGLSMPWILGQLVALAGVLVLFWRACLVGKYRPTPGVGNAALPVVTVVVPAFNEGSQVYRTVQSVIESDYPSEKLYVVAVDDGSQDDTGAWIERAARDFGRRVLAVRYARNRGKRAALYEGFQRARGDVIVTVDSDSEVLPDTIRNLVSPLVVDPGVGAVAGNVRVLNESAGILPKMLDVSFTYSFEFIRASESQVAAVLCCPGALSAYRRVLVEAIQEDWLRQTFLGRPVTIGEDRAMTNMILRHGFSVRFQSNAIVLTEVPERLPQLAKMLLRWGRSNVRETVLLGAFVFTRFRASSAFGARVNFTWSALRTVLSAMFFVPLMVAIVARPTTLGWLAVAGLLAAVLPAMVFALSRSWKHALWAFPYGLLSTFCLSWITPVSVLTPRATGWLTRQIPRGRTNPGVAGALSSSPDALRNASARASHAGA